MSIATQCGTKRRLTTEMRGADIFNTIKLKRENVIGLDIFANNQLVGFAMLRKYSEDGWFLWDYAIDKSYQNQTYGQRALAALIEYMKEIYKIETA